MQTSTLERAGTSLMGTADAQESLISVESLCKSYANSSGARTQILDGLSFSAKPGEFLTVVGPSGTGKTTLLRCLAGLTPPDSGSVKLRGSVIEEPPLGLAVVFQDYSRSLMPWMTVLSNVTLPLRRLKLPKAEMQERASAALSAVGLAESGGLHPWQLSGGMQQRVAIARAIAYQPEALLMDEPFASVDAQTRTDLEDLVLKVRRQFGVTIVLVTHDIDEAVYLADRVIVLNGRPAKVARELEVPLGNDRDQITTKARPEFVNLRAEVLEEIRTAPANAAGSSASASAAEESGSDR
jgi:NitT/TauT family transport system ATP-binding protein